MPFAHIHVQLDGSGVYINSQNSEYRIPSIIGAQF